MRRPAPERGVCGFVDKELVGADDTPVPIGPTVHVTAVADAAGRVAGTDQL